MSPLVRIRLPVWVVLSWKDVAPDGEFLAELFHEDPQRTRRRHLPERVSYQLILGVEDATIPRSSAARWEALRDAEERWPLPYDHLAILESPETKDLLGEMLAGRNDRGRGRGR